MFTHPIEIVLKYENSVYKEKIVCSSIVVDYRTCDFQSLLLIIFAKTKSWR